jgi:TolB-like protein/Tfp pilus assembly protein PilF
VKTTGDGLLAEFASVVDAVRCAVEMQQVMGARNAAIPSERRIAFRIGIHQGDVIVEDGDIFGDGVNIAARLEALAEPGAICVSGRVRSDIHGKLDVAFDDMGEQQVKNIARPVRAYHIRLATGTGGEAAVSSDAPGAQVLALPDKPSIAVLPFANLSGDPEQEYLADGMVEEIITGLSRIKWLFVIARNSSFTYKGRAIDIRQVGRELGVRYVLEGSVRGGGDRVRITAQLLDSTSGAHLWAERYDREIGDMFALQDEIALSVVGAIEPSLRQTEIERVRRKRPESLDAYDLVLRATRHAYMAMPDEAARALPFLEQALALEPDYPAAHAMLAWCFHARFQRGGHSEEDRTAAVRHAHAALKEGADDATAIGIAAFIVALTEHDQTTARAAFDRAATISPSNAFVLGFGSVVLAFTGQAELAIEWAERALRLSPFDPLRHLPFNAMAMAHFTRGRYELAAAASRNAIESNPLFSLLHAVLAASLIRLGQVNSAKLTAARVLVLQPSFRVGATLRSFGIIPPEVAASIGEAWREAGLPEE